MICKGGKRSGSASLATHLLKNDNERIVIVEVKGTATQDLSEALKDMELASKITKAKTGLYHAQINPAKDEAMTPEFWKHSVDEMEKRLGLKDQPRAVVYHEKGGRSHMHVVWQRTDVEKGKVIDTKNDYYIHKKLGRDLEKQFGHKRLKDGFSENWEQMNERQQTIRDGYTPKQLKARIKKLYETHQDPKEFQHALKKAGFDLAIGNRGVVMVSERQEIHSLMRYTATKKKDIEQHLKPILKDLQKVEEFKKSKTKEKTKKVTRSFDLKQVKKAIAENAFDMLTRDEIGKSSAKFDKLKQDFKEKEWERKKSEFTDNNDGITRSRSLSDKEKQARKERERQEKNKREYGR
ncbi:relaxase/mobilization nuclease domain-containing protein [Dokdonia sp.]|uniref:relaxase/mobilization nuclease domain-containing protein n=1 Tax=Dokdonia sp. TaxID=2024995 RepID=UPI003263345B